MAIANPLTFEVGEAISCYFCGYKDTRISGLFTNYVYCEWCGARGPRAETMHVAIRLWNQGIKVSDYQHKE